MSHPPLDLRTVPDLDALVRVGRRTGATLVLDGVVARRIIGALQGLESPKSLIDFVPPLARLELQAAVRPGHGDSTDVVGELRRELPVAGFVGPTLVRRRERARGFLRVTGGARLIVAPTPEAIGTAIAADLPASAMAVSMDERGETIAYSGRTGRKAGLKWINDVMGSAIISEETAPELLREILELLARHHGEISADDETLEQAMSVLERVGGSAVANRLMNFGSHDFQLAVLKYVTALAGDASRGNDPSPDPVSASSAFWTDFKSSATEDPLLLELLDQMADPGRPFRAVVVPLGVGAQWRPLVRTMGPFAPMNDRGGAAIDLDAWSDVLRTQQHADGAGIGVSFPVALEVDDPPDPDCCRYSDFSRNLAEVVWSSPPIGKPLVAIVRLPYDDEFVLAHAYLSVDGIAALRLDYGFLCCMSGRRGMVEVAAVWEQPGEVGSPEEKP